jgi:6-phosphogluconolactonase
MERSNEVLFYVGTYNPEADKAILLVSLNAASGEMRVLEGTKGIENPSFLAVNSTGSVLYAVSEKSKGEVFAYGIDPVTKALNLLGNRLTEGGDPCYISISPKEDYIFVSNYSGGNVNVFPVNADGSLQEMSDQVQHEGSGIREDRQEAAHPHSAIPDGSGKHLLVCDLGLDQILIYRLEEGKLVKHREVELPAGSGPRHLAVHPTGKWVYLINELSCTVTVFANEEQDANLSVLQHLSALPEQYVAGSDDTAADIHVSPCGRFLYVSNRGQDSIALFYIDASTGQLEAVDWQGSGGRTPRNFAIIGDKLLAANQNSDNITSFSIDSVSGRLIPTGHELEIKSPVCVQAI